MADEVDEALVVKRSQQAQELSAEDTQRASEREPQGPSFTAHSLKPDVYSGRLEDRGYYAPAG